MNDIELHLRWLELLSFGSFHKAAIRAKEVWSILWEASGQTLAVPGACTGPDNQIGYGWDNSIHHFGVEIFPDQPIEFFYRNRKTNEVWGEDYEIGNPLPEKVKECLDLFADTKDQF